MMLLKRKVKIVCQCLQNSSQRCSSNNQPRLRKAKTTSKESTRTTFSLENLLKDKLSLKDQIKSSMIWKSQVSQSEPSFSHPKKKN
jgi:hypothetical protein